MFDFRECRREGYSWRGFDTSGHCFLLVWSILFILEEVHLALREAGNLQNSCTIYMMLYNGMYSIVAYYTEKELV
jgi:hypothetical protein